MRLLAESALTGICRNEHEVNATPAPSTSRTRADWARGVSGLFHRTLARARSLASMTEMVGEEPLKHHANGRLFFGPEKRRGFEGELERFVFGQAVLAAKDQDVTVHRESYCQLSDHAEGGFRSS